MAGNGAEVADSGSANALPRTGKIELIPTKPAFAPGRKAKFRLAVEGTVHEDVHALLRITPGSNDSGEALVDLASPPATVSLLAPSDPGAYRAELVSGDWLLTSVTIFVAEPAATRNLTATENAIKARSHAIEFVEAGDIDAVRYHMAKAERSFLRADLGEEARAAWDRLAILFQYRGLEEESEKCRLRSRALEDSPPLFPVQTHRALRPPLGFPLDLSSRNAVELLEIAAQVQSDDLRGSLLVQMRERALTMRVVSHHGLWRAASTLLPSDSRPYLQTFEAGLGRTSTALVRTMADSITDFLAEQVYSGIAMEVQADALPDGTKIAFGLMKEAPLSEQVLVRSAMRYWAEQNRDYYWSLSKILGWSASFGGQGRRILTLAQRVGTKNIGG